MSVFVYPFFQAEKVKNLAPTPFLITSTETQYKDSIYTPNKGLGLTDVSLDVIPLATGLTTSIVGKALNGTIGKEVVQSAMEKWGVGNLRDPARSIGQGEGILIDSSYGLQSKLPNNGGFNDVAIGTYKDSATQYLYTIDNRGINIALEKTEVAGNSVIKHTNISSQASMGGEVWFGPNNTVTINPYSGRFGVGQPDGVSPVKWDATIKLWESLGYKVQPIR